MSQVSHLILCKYIKLQALKKISKDMVSTSISFFEHGKV